jgi:novobiocin biosynthesis protein NovU/D-mycarose 3-C-methyltransferase
MSQFGLFLIDCILTPAHGGSYRIIFGKYANQISSRAQEIFDYETLFNLDSERLGIAITKYHEELSKMEDFLQESFRLGKRIAAFGASGRANMLLGALPQTRKILEFVIDQSPERIGRLMAQNNVPIVDFDGVDCEAYDIVILLAWNFSKEIISKWANSESTFVAPLPQFQIIKNE